LVVAAFVGLPLSAGDVAGQGLPNLVRGNEHFGRLLLENVHRGDPQRNVVISPISLAIILAALQSNSEDADLPKEIANVFGWGIAPPLQISARMLLAAFEEPTRKPPAPKGPMPPGMPREFVQQIRESLRKRREESWITNTILFRGTNERPGRETEPLAQDFVANASKYFGMKFVNTGSSNPTANDLRGARKSVGVLPHVSSHNEMWISSGAHLRTAWKGNTFSTSEPFTAEFRTAGGDKRQVEMITSELSGYPHAVTDSFEAVVLPCNSAYMVAVLPARRKDIQELERDLVDSPDTLDAPLKEELGVVTMPTFHISSERDLRSRLEEMGIRQVFKDLGQIVRIRHSRLTEVEQKIDFQIDKQGIRASAETIFGSVYGGIMGDSPSFKMQIDRPFLFLIRDYNTNALLFIGAVMDPTQTP
jgi:serine protease inhibitor